MVLCNLTGINTHKKRIEHHKPELGAVSPTWRASKYNVSTPPPPFFFSLGKFNVYVR